MLTGMTEKKKLSYPAGSVQLKVSIADVKMLNDFAYSFSFIDSLEQRQIPLLVYQSCYALAYCYPDT